MLHKSGTPHLEQRSIYPGSKAWLTDRPTVVVLSGAQGRVEGIPVEGEVVELRGSLSLKVAYSACRRKTRNVGRRERN